MLDIKRSWIGCIAMLAIACTYENGKDGFNLDGAGTADDSDGTAAGRLTVTDTGDEGPDTATASMTSQTASASDTGEVGECGPSAQCVTAPPEGWFGPVVIALGEAGSPPTPCEEETGYTENGLTLMRGYHDPGPAACSCECTLSGANSCYSYVYDMDAACSQYQTFLQITMDCHPFVVDGGAYFSSFSQGNAFCQGEVTEDLPEPDWDAQVTTCKTEDPGAECSEGVCTPTPPEGFEDTLCIYMEGEQECPAGDFSEQFIQYSGVDDTRNCTNCACGMAAASCMGTLQVFASDDCTGESLADCGVNACTMGVSGGNSVAIDYGSEGVCPVMTPPEPAGTIAVAGAFTYCCTATM